MIRPRMRLNPLLKLPFRSEGCYCCKRWRRRQTSSVILSSEMTPTKDKDDSGTNVELKLSIERMTQVIVTIMRKSWSGAKEKSQLPCSSISWIWCHGLEILGMGVLFDDDGRIYFCIISAKRPPFIIHGRILAAKSTNETVSFMRFGIDSHARIRNDSRLHTAALRDSLHSVWLLLITFSAWFGRCHVSQPAEGHN